MTRQSSWKKSIKNWNWLVDETLGVENEADLCSGDDSMEDPDFTLVATQGVAEGVDSYDNNNGVEHNENEVVRTLESIIEKSKIKANSMDHHQDQDKSSMIDKTPQCPPQSEKALPEKGIKVGLINSLSDLDLASPVSNACQVDRQPSVRLQSNFSNISEIRDYATENIYGGEVPVKALTDETRHAQTINHIKFNGGGGAYDLSDENPGVNSFSSSETVQTIRNNLNINDVNARNDNGLTTKRKLSDSACTSLGSNKIGVEHLEKPIISNMKNRVSVGIKKWESKGSDRIVPMKKGPWMRKSMTPSVPNPPSPRYVNQFSMPAPRSSIMSGGQWRRPKAVISSSTFSKNTVSRMEQPNLSSLEDLGILSVSKKSEDYKHKSSDLTIPSGISVTRIKENKLSLGDLALAVRDVSDNRGQTRSVQLEVTDAQTRGLKALGLIEDYVIIL